MRKNKLFLSLLMVMLLSVGNVWADPAAVGTTLFSEDFSGYAKDAVPSGSVTTATGRVVYGGANVTYACTDGNGTKPGATKIYNEATGGGTAPEILVGKYGSGGSTGGSFSVSGIPSGGAKAITVSYTQNKQKLKVAISGTGYTSDGIDAKPADVGTVSFDITVADGADATFALTFSAYSSNVRVDDILVTVKTAGEGGAPVTPTCAIPTFDPEDGETFTDDIDVEIACETDGATIYYTTNGSNPTTSSNVYSSALNFTATTTLKAMAVKAGYDNSAVAAATYTKVVPFSGSILEIVKGDFTTSSYDDNAGDHEKSGITFTTAKVYQSGGGIQFQKTNGLLYNKTDLGEIAKIEITTVSGKSNNLVVYSGTTENPTSGAVTGSTSGSVTTYTFAAGKGFFAIKCNSTGASNVDPIKIYYTSATPSSVDKPTISGTESFVTSTTVTISHADADHIYYTTNGDAPTTSSAEYTAPFSLTNTATVKAIAVKGSDVSAVAEKAFTKVEVLESLAELKAKNTGSSYLLNLTDAIVTLVDGNNAFIEDATAGALIYFSGHGYAAGDKLNGLYEVTTATYQGKFEITEMTAQDGATKTADAEIPVTTLTIAQLAANFAANESKRIKIVGVNVTDAIANNDRNGQISDGANTFALYAGKNGVTAAENANIDVIGYPTFFSEAHQFNVWAQADITVNEKENPELAYDPASETIEQGDAWSAPALTNPHSVTISSYASNNESVATVSDAGVIALAGGLGTAVITAHFNGDATYNAGNATYTITVEEADARNNAVSPAAFTTTSGNLNPADITYASYQGGSSTAPAIYNDGIRLYQISGTNDFGGFVTITAKAGCTIDEVQITTTSKYATTVAYSKDGNENLLGEESVAKSGSYTTGTGLNVSSVNILNLGTGSEGRLEIASIKVYYTGEAATIDHYELGGTYQTAFMQDEEFNHTGLIVYAVYDALGENKVDITSMCTFSEPDMSTTGEKTIEITYNEAVVISYKINVAADSRKVAESPATFTTVSGDMTPNDITFASNQGGASTAPANYNDGIRLYQISGTNTFGGFITLTAKAGCTIDQVKITTTNSYATTVAYSVDGNENLLGSESVAKSSDYSTPSGLNVGSVNIVNKGTGSSGRLEIASIKVWYTGDALAVDHYILGGTYATEFEQYGEFNYEGLTVTAAYDAGETITEAVTGFTVEADLSTAGAAKANVMLNSVKIAEYDITVTASAKEDPALAYSPASVVLTLGDALSAPTFSNTHNVSPITYSSDKPAVATVDADGNIALAGDCGTAVITASFAGDDDYIDSEATFTITVNEPAEDLSGTWALVTDAEQLAAGKKIVIAYCGLDGDYLVAKTMGAQNTNNRAAVESSTKTATDYTSLTLGPGTKVFTLVDAGEGKFAIKASNGKYLTSATSGTSNNLLEAADYSLDNAKWTISISNEVASIVAAAGNKTVMQYNSSNTLFSCYVSANQKPVRIYMLQEDTPEPPTPDWTEVRSELTIGKHYTICLKKKITAVNGATFWTIGKHTAHKVAYLEEAQLPLTAGEPFIFQATADKLEVVYEGEDVDNPVTVEGNALRGTFEDMDAAALAAACTNMYMLSNNQICSVTHNNGNFLSAFRAYIDDDAMIDVSSAPQPVPGRKVKSVPMQGNVATGIDETHTSMQATKMLIDGQLFIICGEKMYDVTGSLVK